MGRALQDVFGTPGAVQSYEFAGRTDRRIVSDLMVAEGWSAAEIDARLPLFYKRMVAAGRDLFTPERIRPCPGVPALLDALAARDDVALALLTGNIRDTVPLKLAAAGIDSARFQVGAFGSDSADRNELFDIALQRAETTLGLRPAVDDVIVVGDTPADIGCARAGGSRVLAVATGPFPAEVLLTHRPDYLFADLSATDDVLRAMFSRESVSAGG